MDRKLPDYSAALILSLSATGLTYHVPLLVRIPWTPAFLVVAVAARYLGFGPAVLAIILSSVSTYVSILAPANPLSLHPVRLIETFVFGAGALLITYLVCGHDKVLASLRVSESHHRSVAETASDVIVTIDLQSTILSINPAVQKVFGYAPDELIGQPLMLLMPEEYRAAHIAGVARYLKAGERHIPWTGVQLSGRRKDGEEIPIEISFGSYSVEGETRFTGFIRDISDRRAAHAALVQSEKLAAVGRLSSSIAHEINNPLEAITNLIYLARASEDVTEIHDLMEIADREIRRISVIANQTLQFHKESPTPTSVQTTELMRGSLSLFQGRLVNAGISVLLRERAQQQAVCVEGQIRQVLTNLIGNAIDALPAEGGRILLRTRDGVDWATGRSGVILTVADSGTGMDAATCARIFDPFFTTKGIGGAGLGLWISCQMVEQNAGNLRVKSSRLEAHSGTVFTLFLPSRSAA